MLGEMWVTWIAGFGVRERKFVDDVAECGAGTGTGTGMETRFGLRGYACEDGECGCELEEEEEREG